MKWANLPAVILALIALLVVFDLMPERRDRAAPLRTSAPVPRGDLRSWVPPEPPPTPLPAQPGAGLSGVVLMRGSRTPVPGASVYQVPAGTRSVPREKAVVTDAEGRFELPRIDGTDDLGAFAPGVRPARVTFDPSVGADEAVEILMDAGATIEGVVVRDDGSPVSGASVWAHRPQNREAWPMRDDRLPVAGLGGDGAMARTDRDGRFSLQGLGEGRFEVRASKPGHAFWQWDDPPLHPAGARGVNLTLAPVFRLAYRVVDSRGAPITTAHAIIRKSSRGLGMPADFYRGERSSASAPEGLGADGWTRMTYARLEPEISERRRRVVIRVQAPGFRPREHTTFLEPGETRIEVRLERDDRTPIRRVALMAKLADKPFTGRLGITVFHARDPERLGDTVVEFREGTARTPLRLPARRYRLRPHGWGNQGMFWPAGDSVPVRVVDHDEPTPVTLVLRGTPVYLNVVDAEGRRVRGFDLAVTPARGYRGLVRRWDTLGHSAWSRDTTLPGPDLYLPPGPAAVRAEMPGMGSASARVVAKGDGAPVELRLPLTGPVAFPGNR